MIKLRRYHKFGKERLGIWDEITDWCFKNFGVPSSNGEWDYIADVGWMDFYFRDEKAAELFILKWM